MNWTFSAVSKGAIVFSKEYTRGDILFCINCGKEIVDGSIFCQNCGRKLDNSIPILEEVKSQTTKESSKDMEIVIDVFTGVKKVSLIKTLPWVFVFTNYRLIIAVITSEMQKKVMKEAKGFFGKIGSIQDITDRRRYLHMSPCEILSEDPENFVIEYNSIKKISFKRSSFVKSTDPDVSDYTKPPIFNMEYGAEKIKTHIGNIRGLQEFEENFIYQMSNLFGNKFSYK